MKEPRGDRDINASKWPMNRVYELQGADFITGSSRSFRPVTICHPGSDVIGRFVQPARETLC